MIIGSRYDLGPESLSQPPEAHRTSRPAWKGSREIGEKKQVGQCKWSKVDVDPLTELANGVSISSDKSGSREQQALNRDPTPASIRSRLFSSGLLPLPSGDLGRRAGEPRPSRAVKF